MSLSPRDQIYPRCVISASCTYEFPISVAGTYTLFLLCLYIIRILYVVAQATIRGGRQEPPVYSTLSRRRASCVFARDIDLSFLPKLNSRDRTTNITACIMPSSSVPVSSLIRGRFLRSLSVSLCLSSVTHHRLWTASRTRAN